MSLSLVSLTITVYMIVQGLAPSFWGPLSDTKGRRITFIGKFMSLNEIYPVLTCSQALSLFILQPMLDLPLAITLLV